MEALVRKHHIKPANIWNFDEKGFLLGICHATKRIVPVKHLKGQYRGTVQDGSREFISVLACINAIGESLPPALIYQGDSGDLQNT
jgi:DDE superfamily endonuclease